MRPAQQQLRIVIVGCGGLGIPAALALLNSSLPDLDLFLVDHDRVERSNLNRQILFRDQDVGRPKAELLKTRLEELAPSLALPSHNSEEKPALSRVITAEVTELNSSNIYRLLHGADFVIDATDSTATKFLLNDYCVTHRIPYCYGGVVSERGQVLAVVPDEEGKVTACLRCLFGDYSTQDYNLQSTTCQQAGILGPVAGVLGIVQAQRAIQYFCSGPGAVGGQLLRFDGTSLGFHNSALLVAADCSLSHLPRARVVLDIRDQQCPASFLYTKVALEKITSPTTVEVILGNAASVDNVVRSSREEGYFVSEEPILVASDVWKISIHAPRKGCDEHQ